MKVKICTYNGAYKESTEGAKNPPPPPRPRALDQSLNRITMLVTEETKFQPKF